MKLILQPPKKSLSKVFLRQRPLRPAIERFRNNLLLLLSKVDEIEREENQKNHIMHFLRDTYYQYLYEINTKDTKDLVIHTGKTNKDIKFCIATNIYEWFIFDASIKMVNELYRFTGRR